MSDPHPDEQRHPQPPAPRDARGRYLGRDRPGVVSPPVATGSGPAPQAPVEAAVVGATGVRQNDHGAHHGRRRTVFILLGLLLLLLICGGFGYFLWWDGAKSLDSTTGTARPTATATGVPAGGAVVATPATPSPTPPSATSTPSASVSASATPSATTGPASSVAVPNLVGRNALAVDQELRGYGFTKVTFVRAGHPDQPVQLLAGLVVTGQSVPAGTNVPVGTAIVVACDTPYNGRG